MSEINCNLCQNPFAPISNPKKICRFCGKEVCKRCSHKTTDQNNATKRICDKCVQTRIQQKILNSPNFEISSLLELRELKSKEKQALDLEIKELEREKTLYLEDINDYSSLQNKEIDVIREKRLKLTESLKVLKESYKKIIESENLFQEEIKKKQEDIERYNGILIDLNKESSKLDDKIFQIREMMQKIMNDNETLQAVINHKITEFTVKGKGLQKKVERFHRMTMALLENMNYDAAFLEVEIKELENKVREMRLELALKKDLYQNSHIYLSVNEYNT